MISLTALLLVCRCPPDTQVSKHSPHVSPHLCAFCAHSLCPVTSPLLSYTALTQIRHPTGPWSSCTVPLHLTVFFLLGRVTTVPCTPRGVWHLIGGRQAGTHSEATLKKVAGGRWQASVPFREHGFPCSGLIRSAPFHDVLRFLFPSVSRGFSSSSPCL